MQPTTSQWHTNPTQLFMRPTELRGGKQFSMKLDAFVDRNQGSASNNINNQKTKEILLKEEDISAHKQMLKKIKKPIWNKFNY